MSRNLSVLVHLFTKLNQLPFGGYVFPIAVFSWWIFSLIKVFWFYQMFGFSCLLLASSYLVCCLLAFHLVSACVSASGVYLPWTINNCFLFFQIYKVSLNHLIGELWIFVTIMEGDILFPVILFVLFLFESNTFPPLYFRRSSNRLLVYWTGHI